MLKELRVKAKILMEKSNGYSTSDLYKDVEIILTADDIIAIANVIVAASAAQPGFAPDAASAVKPSGEA